MIGMMAVRRIHARNIHPALDQLLNNARMVRRRAQRTNNLGSLPTVAGRHIALILITIDEARKYKIEFLSCCKSQANHSFRRRFFPAEDREKPAPAYSNRRMGNVSFCSHALLRSSSAYRKENENGKDNIIRSTSISTGETSIFSLQSLDLNAIRQLFFRTTRHHPSSLSLEERQFSRDANYIERALIPIYVGPGLYN